MSVINRKHRTKNLALSLRNRDARKQAGSNRLAITVNSDDWRIPDQTVRMTIRDARALRSFLNDYLGD
jgi:hypothetical protein